MIAYGPNAATAALTFLEAPNGRTNRPLLSPKSRKALDWLRTERGKLPLSLRNSLEYLLIGLKTSGVDLDDLFASRTTTASEVYPRTISTQPAEVVPPSPPQGRPPPLPEATNSRIEVLRHHLDALADLCMLQPKFERRQSLSIALRKLNELSPDLRPSEIADLWHLYEQLQQSEKGTRT